MISQHVCKLLIFPMQTFVGISRCQTPENITQTNCGFVANPDSSIVDTQVRPEEHWGEREGLVWVG